MTRRVLIVHDGRIPAGAGAVVLARLLRRCDERDIAVHHMRTGQNARYFWTSEVERLLEESDNETELILFGVPFYDFEGDIAGAALKKLREAYGSLQVWSHRWPDGYSNSMTRVHIPPHDIVYGPLGLGLTPPEKRLLRLSLIAARTVPVVGYEADVTLVEALSHWVDADDTNWDVLVDTNDLELVFAEAESTPTPRSRAGDATVVEQHDNYLDLDIEGAHVGHEIAIIDEVLDQHPGGSHRVIVAWLGEDRVLICRRDPGLELPSLRWLIVNRFHKSVPLPIQDQRYGPQDSVYFRLSGQDTKAALRAPLRELAKQLSAATTGRRYLTAALARDIAGLANKVFKSIDLTGRHTDGDKPAMEVAATDLYDLVHTSSRTGERRRTLTIPIRAKGPEAAAFFFTDGGYNFQRAERLLEGAVLGLGWREVAWLGLPEQTKRLRLDVRPMQGEPAQGDIDIERVRAALREPRIKSIRAQDLVSRGSVIGRFLDLLNLDSLVTIADSETIGPSVAHALTLLAAASASADNPQSVSVLDLFAGSGVANRLLTMSGFHVTSVDLYVSASDVGLDTTATSTGLWLRADARAVLDRKSPLIERDFDVIGLDPPHSELVELLFGAEGADSLARLCARRSKLLVLYQGHSTQRGRLDLVFKGLLEAGWLRQAVLQVEEELIVLAATEGTGEATFEALVQRIVDDVRLWCSRHKMDDVHADVLTSS